MELSYPSLIHFIRLSLHIIRCSQADLFCQLRRTHRFHGLLCSHRRIKDSKDRRTASAHHRTNGSVCPSSSSLISLNHRISRNRNGLQHISHTGHISSPRSFWRIASIMLSTSGCCSGFRSLACRFSYTNFVDTLMPGFAIRMVHLGMDGSTLKSFPNPFCQCRSSLHTVRHIGSQLHAALHQRLHGKSQSVHLIDSPQHCCAVRSCRLPCRPQPESVSSAGLPLLL